MTLIDIADEYNSDKKYSPTNLLCHNFVLVYEELFKEFKEKPINLLELGIGDHPQYCGDSLLIWSKYFTHPSTRIIGIDYNLTIIEKVKQKVNDNRVFIEYGDQDSVQSIEKVTKNQKFDIIIDDGSHKNNHITSSFNLLWPKLNTNGLYIIEDIYHSYENPHEFTSLQMTHKLIDDMNLKLQPISFIHFYHQLVIIKKGDNITR